MDPCKSKVRSSVQDIADDLIKLYAERQTSKGYGFDKDSAEQQEFEDMFPYDETRDQMRAIEEIKKIWNKIVPWIVCCVGTLVTEKRK